MSELAAEAVRSPAIFAAHWAAPVLPARAARARPTAIAVSVAVHMLALLAGAAAWQHDERRAVPPPSVRVTMLTRPQLPAMARAPAPAPAAAPAPSAPPPRRTPPPKPLMAVPQPIEPQPAPAPQPVVATAESAPDAGSALAAQPLAESAGAEQGTLGGAAPTGTGDGLPAGFSEPPPPISQERRQAMLASYLQEIFRSRIAAHFQYPEEAERLGMEGLVVVRASVLPTGALWSARTLGDCPHRVLCTAAERTVRAAAPFPPPPAELGGAISIDVPLNYRLE